MFTISIKKKKYIYVHNESMKKHKELFPPILPSRSFHGIRAVGLELRRAFQNTQ